MALKWRPPMTYPSDLFSSPEARLASWRQWAIEQIVLARISTDVDAIIAAADKLVQWAAYPRVKKADD
jgi:hypothetical protein